MQFKTIQQKLNKLCSQHDEYMALLDIIDYLANIKPLTQNNRNISSKITQLEQQVQEIQKYLVAQRSQQRQFGNLKLEKLKNNITSIEYRLENYNSQLLQLDQQTKKIENESENLSFNSELIRTNASVQSIIEKQTSNLQFSVASFKNELEQKIIDIEKKFIVICEPKRRQQSSTQQQTFKSKQKLNIHQQRQCDIPIKDLFKSTIDEYDQLMHEIMLYKLQFPNPPITPFVWHNSQSIKQKIAWLYSKVSIEEKLDDSQFKILQNQYQTLFYRTKALKNYALCELLQMYQEKKHKIQVNRLQKQIELMIRELQYRCELFKEFLTRAEIMRKTRLQVRSRESARNHILSHLDKQYLL